MSALSCVSNRPFEHWSDTDVERFPGLAEGIALIFKQAWKNFGNVTEMLDESELTEKGKIHSVLSRHLLDIRQMASSKVFCAALREFLNEVEEQTNQENSSATAIAGKKVKGARKHNESNPE